MTTLELKGEVEFDGGLLDQTVTIGGTDVLDALHKKWPDTGLFSKAERPTLKFFLGAEPVAEGPTWTAYGFGGTDVTPAESPVIQVGQDASHVDICDKLYDYDGREVLLVVEGP